MREQFVLRPFGQARRSVSGIARGLFLQHAEQRALPALPVLDDARRARQRAVDLREQRRARFAQSYRTRRI